MRGPAGPQGPEGPIGPVGPQGPAGISVATRGALASLADTDKVAFLYENNRERTFVFKTGDWSAHVANDPAQGVVVPPASDPSGAAGAWVAVHKLEFDARWFGAVAYATDLAAADVAATGSAAAINRAINYANFLGGGTVFIPPGWYQCELTSGGSTSVSMKSNVTLEGRGGTLIVRNGATVHAVRCIGISNFKITKLRVHNNRGNVPLAGTHCIEMEGCSDYEVTHNYVRSSHSYAITSQDNGVRANISHNTIEDAGADGIDFHNALFGATDNIVSKNLIISFNVSSLLTKAGIHIRGYNVGCEENIIRGCGTGTAGVAGILAGNGETVTGQRVVNNIIQLGALNADLLGVAFDNPSTVVQGNVVIADAANNHSSGIAASGIDSAIDDNMLVGPFTESGIRVDGINGAAGVSVQGNTTKNSAQYGVYVKSAPNTYVADNVNINCAVAGIRVDAASTNTVANDNANRGGPKVLLNSSPSTIRDGVNLLTLADDTVAVLPIPNGSAGLLLMVNSLAPSSTRPSLSAIVCGSAAAVPVQMSVTDATNVAYVNTALTGTTGADGKLTIGCPGDGKVYIENRLGASKVWGVSFPGFT